eukprot:CAMPEP_0118708758 /NCGR_PEP_ID=MMETSP0800-20121206/22130_1 /TAXON_ID=210618 ORGANISM="Striatella unipunctata, Strain CCMP2910" /NCGR_SAMPLE_ID=MMETSP0800 /ASSEMBLY_ACC=CAM_ASM_000638 /LENGTH=77 /DNA_ID=CAMNT_0006612117 /DNA_START=14 /DNA_END=243 /DNA_ORIENTATION=+
MSRSAVYGYDQRTEIFGTDGMVAVGNEFAHEGIVSTRDGVLHSKLKHSFPQRFHHAFAAELDALGGVILGKQKWPVT